ncbi:conjugal transfer protein TraG N-terminal domain-containing protein [Deferribacter abyssi]|uniref:conjugal transfer protein TraG N-terminal domain-containing protein n=1 Tax=Deferribacter abyssi TaxID=213806 RepID=UPI003C1ED0A4
MRKLSFSLFILLFPVVSFADDFVYRCFGNLPVISSTLNAIAMIMNSSSYGRLLQFVMLIGMVLATVYSVYTKKYDVLIYPAGAILILGLFFWSKASVTIYDENTGEVDVVDNVPIGFAYGATTVSAIGYYFTKVYEQAFAIPTTTILFGKQNDVIEALQYSKIGLGGAFQSMRDIRNFDLDTKRNLLFKDYYENCLSWEIMAASDVDIDIFFKHSQFADSNGTINCNRFPNGLGTRWTLPTVIGDTETTCKYACENVLKPALQDYIDDIFLKYTSEPRLATAYLSMNNVLSTFTDVSYTMKQSLMQNAVIRGIFNGVISEAFEAGKDLTAYSGILSFLQSNEQGKSLAYYAAEYIPAYRNVMEAIMIAVFPIVLIMFLFPRGWVFIKGYILSLFWIQLWHPIASVMNSIMVMMALKKSALISELVNSGYSMLTAKIYAQYADSMIGVTGFMTMSIPAIATIVVYGGNWVAGRIADGMARSAMVTAGASYNPEQVRQWLRQNVTAQDLGDPGVDKVTKIYQAARHDMLMDYQYKTGAMEQVDRASKVLGMSAGDVVKRMGAGQTVSSISNAEQMLNVQDTVGLQKIISTGSYDKLVNIAKSDYIKQQVGWNLHGKALGMDSVANIDSTLKAPDRAREALTFMSSYYDKVANWFERQGDIKHANEFREMSQELRNTTKLGDQEVMNAVKTLEKSGVLTSVLGKEIAAKVTGSGGYSAHEGITSMQKGTTEVREGERKLGEYVNTSSGQNLAFGALRAAKLHADIDSLTPKDAYTIQRGKNELDKGEWYSRLQYWGNWDTYRKAVASESMFREAMMDGRIKAWDTDGDGRISKKEAEDNIAKYSMMASLMDKSEAQQFWKTFENDPNKAIQALEMKYGETYEGLKQFAELAKEKGWDVQRLGAVFANKKLYQAGYDEGFTALLRDLAPVLGVSEAALKGSDPKMTAIRGYAQILYRKVRDGEISSEDIKDSLLALGISRATATVLKGSKGDIAMLGLQSGVKMFSDLFPSKEEWNESIQQVKRDFFNPIKGKNIVKNEDVEFKSDPLLEKDPRFQKVDDSNRAEMYLKVGNKNLKVDLPNAAFLRDNPAIKK